MRGSLTCDTFRARHSVATSFGTIQILQHLALELGGQSNAMPMITQSESSRRVFALQYQDLEEKYRAMLAKYVSGVPSSSFNSKVIESKTSQTTLLKCFPWQDIEPENSGACLVALEFFMSCGVRIFHAPGKSPARQSQAKGPDKCWQKMGKFKRPYFWTLPACMGSTPAESIKTLLRQAQSMQSAEFDPRKAPSKCP